MELIKKIKQAEAESQEIIEQAKVEAARLAEKGREGRLAALAQAEQERKKAIEAAVSKAESEGIAEIKGMKVQADKVRQSLREKAAGKMSAATEKIIDYLRG